MPAILQFRTRLVFFLCFVLFVIMVFFYTLFSRLPTYSLDDPITKNKPTYYQPLPKKYNDVKVREEISFTVEPEEKFLAYFTHSGYHNQRIALENALLLSKLLNRTLLLPPVLFGPPVPWSKFDKLYERLFLTTKNGLEHCVDIPIEYPLPLECLNYYTYTTVSWDFLINMKPIREWNKIIDRWDHSFEWMERNFGIKKEIDIHYIRDTTLWDYRIYDSDEPSEIFKFDKYKRKLKVSELIKVDKKVIHLGSLFGSYRVLPELPTSQEHLNFIRKNIIPHNSLLREISDRIVEQLGGEKKFIGLHIRVSDGFFMKTARKNIDSMYHEIVDSFTNLTSQVVYELEGGTHEQDILEDDSVDLGNNDNKKSIATGIMNETIISDTTNTTKIINKRAYIPDLSNKINEFSNKVNCKNRLHPTDQGVNTVIFIATDITSPRNSSLLFKFFNTFPCVFVLDDFDQDLTNIKFIRNIDDKTPMGSYLIPMLDAMISAKGFRFIGTPKSTFSNYIDKTLHPAEQLYLERF